MTDLQRFYAQKRRVEGALLELPGVQAVGVGDGTIRVYVTSAPPNPSIPRHVEGIPIEIMVGGEVQLQSLDNPKQPAKKKTRHT